MNFKSKISKYPDKVINRINKIANSMKGPNSVLVGLPKGSNNYPDGTSVIRVGIIHEFGAPSMNIPQRSYLRSTIKENNIKYKKLFEKLTFKMINSDTTMNKSLRYIGETVKGDVIAKITKGIPPPLKVRKGTPLVDTGHLRQSITYVIRES